MWLYMYVAIQELNYIIICPAIRGITYSISPAILDLVLDVKQHF
jgi:hypothetical protein